MRIQIKNCTFAIVLGQLPEWPNGSDCNSDDLRLRWFESITAHKNNDELRIQNYEKNVIRNSISGSSSVDRALAFQAEGRGFESRLPLSGA